MDEHAEGTPMPDTNPPEANDSDDEQDKPDVDVNPEEFDKGPHGEDREAREERVEGELYDGGEVPQSSEGSE